MELIHRVGNNFCVTENDSDMYVECVKPQEHICTLQQCLDCDACLLAAQAGHAGRVGEEYTRASDA